MAGIAGAAEELLKVGSHLTSMGMSYEYDLSVVRGLDYYTGIVFEVACDLLGAEKQIAGGGAYALPQVLGGDPTPCFGFGLGFDRILLALDKEMRLPRPRARKGVYIIPITEEANYAALALSRSLRPHMERVDVDLANRGVRRALETANRLGARVAVILGKQELAAVSATVRNLLTGEQRLVPLDQAVDAVMWTEFAVREAEAERRGENPLNA